ncbi:MAG: 4-carboxymuconolactone decarboxylase domain/alkylhydroperoxidase AhpD family core domain protein [Frankiales bacterium]|nr:4-carboxymuconolactone decarboxylase domain/alkylhydroperoxidase AhpD family core domain protein [Frankiales bacterium]
MARIDLPEGDGLDVAKALTKVPHFIDVVVGYEKAIAASPIDPRLHELVRMRIANLNQCVTCLEFRRDDSGLDEAILAAVPEFATSALFTDLEKQALLFTELFCTTSTDISDELIADLEAELGTAGVADLALVIGKYLAMGRFMQVLGLDQACKIDHARLAGVAGS